MEPYHFNEDNEASIRKNNFEKFVTYKNKQYQFNKSSHNFDVFMCTDSKCKGTIKSYDCGKVLVPDASHTKACYKSKGNAPKKGNLFLNYRRVEEKKKYKK